MYIIYSLTSYWETGDWIDPSQAHIGLYNYNPCTNCGGNDNVDKRREGWVWLDGTEYDHEHYHNWNGQDGYEPQESEQCARLHVLREERGWLSDTCSTGNYGYVCKKGNLYCSPLY